MYRRLSVEILLVLIIVASGWATEMTEGSQTQEPSGSEHALSSSDSPSVNARGKDETDRLLTNAVLREEWAAIVDMLSLVNDANLPAEYRAIKGHACLATNRSNESLELFMSLLNGMDQRSWQRWSDEFARQYPERALALYLQGDGLARLGRWREAETCFSRALQLDPQCYLAWNARGVTSHALGNTLMARMYFSKANKAREDFADAYASRGALSVCLRSLREGETGPEGLFMNAFRCSQNKEPALVLLGLGCVKYGKQVYDESRRHYDNIPQTSCLSALAQRDALMVELARLEHMSEMAGDVGTSVIGQTLHVNMNYDSDSGGISDEDWSRIIQIAYEKLERLRQLYSEQCGGAAAASAYCQELLRQITELEEAIAEITRGNRKGNVRPLLDAVTDMVVVAIGEVNRAMANRRGRNSENRPRDLGGVDSDVGGIRVNRGGWKVSTVYGLLYPVPGLDSPL